MKDTKWLDFSCKSHILLEDEQGNRVPMSEPYFRVEEIAPKTWKILTDGDYSYLLEGEDDALLIDSGYGAGDIRAYCENMIGRPVSRIVNTHDHFDHTALNGLFDLAYMAEETVPLATVPFPSFEGITFSRDYDVEVVDDGSVIPLKGRDLLVFKIPDHAVGSIVLLDRKERILFVGDEIGMPFGKPISTSVENWLRLMDKIVPFLPEFDIMYGGAGRIEKEIFTGLYENCQAILSGAEGEVQEPRPFNNWQKTDDEGHIIWKRKIPHPGDGPKHWNKDSEWKRKYGKEPTAIVYDIRRVRDVQE